MPPVKESPRKTFINFKNSQMTRFWNPARKTLYFRMESANQRIRDYYKNAQPLNNRGES